VRTPSSICRRLHTDDFAVLALSGNLERTAANLAIRREPLSGDACVNNHLTSLAAVGTLDFSKFFHAAI
jgi:hypothetical protein